MALKKNTLLTPHVSCKIWGGSRLAQLKKLSEEKIGETWEVSIHPDGPSEANGTKLNQLLTSDELPYLIKFIDTSDHLSVQVHPADDYAKKVENSSGKTECWLILDAGPNSGIYLGFKAGVRSEEFEKAVRSGADLTQYLQFHSVKAGDFFFVPAGSVHAIGADVFLCETQQSSGITYRVWDWNRLDHAGNSRELHIDKAMDVLRFEEDFNGPDNFSIKHDLFNKNENIELVDHPQFHVELFNLEAGEKLELAPSKKGRQQSLITLTGKLLLDQNMKLNTYNSLLLGEHSKTTVEVIEKSSFILVS